MATEYPSCRFTKSKAVLVSLHRKSDGYVFDADDSTWKVNLAACTTPKVAATADVSMTGDVDAVYVATIDMTLDGDTTTPLDILVVFWEDLTTDEIIAVGEATIVSGAISSVATTDAASNNAIVDAMLDEVNTGGTHNIKNSVGKQIREASETLVISTGTAQGPGANSNQIQLAATASSTDGAYDPALVVLTEGTGIGQTRLILEYEGSTRTATVDRTWKVNPDATSEYTLIPHPGREHVNEGLSQGGAASTITLNALASSCDRAYERQIIFLRSGMGEDQSRIVTDYVGSTKVATVNRAWDTIPDATSAYVMLPATINDKTGYTLSTAGDNSVADALLLRSIEEIIAAVSGLTGTDRVCLAVAVLGQLRAKVNGATIEYYKPDGTTLLFTSPVTSDADAEPITGVGVS